MWKQLIGNYLKSKNQDDGSHVQRSHMDVSKNWKVGLYNKKIKIYQTIKGLIILFIKLQFFIRCNQAFKPLRTLTSNIYLNLSFISNSFITYIISDIFVSSPIHFMIPDMHLQRSLYIQSKLGSGLRCCQTWEPLVYLPEDLHYSRQCPDVVIENEANICTKKKS